VKSWTVDDHLAGKDSDVVDLYHQFVRLIEACGPFEYAVAKTAISFKGTRRGFAGAVLARHSLDGHLDLQRRIEADPRIRRSAPYTKRLFVHHFRVTTPEQLDEEFAGWLREAYAVGQGAHLTE
jgi:hypothetical protein